MELIGDLTKYLIGVLQNILVGKEKRKMLEVLHPTTQIWRLFGEERTSVQFSLEEFYPEKSAQTLWITSILYKRHTKASDEKLKNRY